MRGFAFHPGPSLIAGEGQAVALANVLPSGPCLLVSDKQLVALGLIDACRAALADSGRDVVLFDSVEEDPSRNTLEAAVAAGRDGSVRSVVGFGGGSPM